ncbi:hypothetical protein ABT187_29745 [Streptomyces sp. NPDC001817]
MLRRRVVHPHDLPTGAVLPAPGVGGDGWIDRSSRGAAKSQVDARHLDR